MNLNLQVKKYLFFVLVIFLFGFSVNKYKAIYLNHGNGTIITNGKYLGLININGWINIDSVNAVVSDISIKARGVNYPLVSIGNKINVVSDSFVVNKNYWKWYNINYGNYTDKLFIRLLNNNTRVDIDSIKISIVDSSYDVKLDTLIGNSLVVSWAKNKDIDLAGYRLYYGNYFRRYTNMINVGIDTFFYLRPDYYKRWDFSVTAYDTANNESKFSNDVAIYFMPYKTIPIDTIPPQEVLRLNVSSSDSVIIIIK